MSYSRDDIIDYTPSFLLSETTTSSLHPFFTLSSAPPLFPHLHHDHVITSAFPAPFDPFSPDLLQIESTTTLPICSYKRVTRRVSPVESQLLTISDRVSSLESRLDRLLSLKEKEKVERTLQLREADRKYTWTAEIKGGKNTHQQDRKYKWTAEIGADDVLKGKRGERKYQWSTELKGKGDEDEKRIYTWKTTIAATDSHNNKNKVHKEEENKDKKKKSKSTTTTRIVEIEDEPLDHHRALLMRQAFAKRVALAKRVAHDKGKKKELSPSDAAALIQMSFRAYLIRRSQALRALRELAVAKTKLKELRSLFHNFSYRSRVARDAEERQKFAENIIVLLLTVDAIEGVDLMVRAAKRSMVDELEAMLDVVDPQPNGRSLSIKRRTFDMPSGTIQKEIAEGVAQVVQMLDQENATFEACL